MPCCILGDFNDVLFSHKKFRGRPVNFNRAQLLKDGFDDCGMLDLRFNGLLDTRSNSQYSPNLIQCKLNRLYTNFNGILLDLKYFVTHLPKSHSDHYHFD